MIKALCDAGEWQRAECVFKQIGSHDVAPGEKPDLILCSSMIRALGEAGEWQSAERLLKQIGSCDVAPGEKPDLIT